MKPVFSHLLSTIIFTMLLSLNGQAQIVDWTWESGSNTINQNGVYGTMGVPDTNNQPGSRNGHVMWQGNDGNIWLFGGLGYGATGGTGRLNDLWRFNPTTLEWTWMKGSNAINGAGTYGTQGLGDTANTPTAQYRMTSWTDTAGNLWMFGGLHSSIHNELWMFEIQSNSWTYVDGGTANWGTQGVTDTANQIPGRMKALAWKDSNDIFWIFGGVISGRMNDMWKYDRYDQTWTWMKGTQTANAAAVHGTIGVEDSLNLPHGRWFAANWETSDGYLWMGLGDAAPSGLQNDIWKYNLNTNNWTWVNGSQTGNALGNYDSLGAATAANAPRSREAMAFWTDNSGKFWLFGGISSGGNRSDLWMYDPSTNLWTWQGGPTTGNATGSFGTKGISSPTNNPPTRYYTYGASDVDGDLWLFGGHSPWGRWNDMWELKLCQASFALSVDTNVSCFGGSNGVATALLQEGTAPYSYTWNTGDTTSTINSLTAGTYKVTISDYYGCGGVLVDTVTEPTLLSTTVAVDSNVQCNGQSNGSVTASTSGGTTSYSYIWNNSATTASNSGLQSGTYTVTVTDANGCTAIDNATVTQPIALISIMSADSHVTCHGYSDGGASAIVTGGSSPYTYQWSSGASAASATNLPAGPHIVTITDNNNCIKLDTITINEPSSLAISLNSAPPTCGYDSLGYSFAQVNGGTSPYSYAWSNGQISTVATNLGEGTFSVVVTDDNDCTIEDSVTLVATSHIAGGIVSSTDILCYGDTTGFIAAAVDSGVAPYTYAWSNGSNETQQTTVAGPYMVTITDSVGCYVVDNDTIWQPDSLVILLSVADEVCEGDENGSILAHPEGGEGAYSYAWSNGVSSFDNDNLIPGNYVLTVTDGNGCTAEIDADIEPGNPLPTPYLGNDTTFTSNGGLILNPGSFFSYNWSTGDLDSLLLVTTTGTYSVTVSDEDGCEGYDEISIEIWPLGISDGPATDLRLFPNPTSGHVFLESEAGFENMQLILEDMKGATVRTWNPNATHRLSLDVSGPAGMYLLKMYDGDRWIGTHKIVVQP